MSNPRRSASTPYATSQTHTPRYSGAHSNSSAYSRNAQPNEDWTQVSDLAERRRIQNRIAQRNYRQKLKRRLEELEHRSGSPSASPEREGEQSGTASTTTSVSSDRRRRTTSQPNTSSRGGQFDVQHLNLFSQPYDETDSRMLGYQFCAQPSPPPPPSPPLPESAAYASVEHTRFSPHGVPPSSPWTSTASQAQFYAASANQQPTPAANYYGSYAYSPNLSASSTPAKPDSQYWHRGSQDDGWGTSWSYGGQNDPSYPTAPAQAWKQEGSQWQEHYHDATSSKFSDDGFFHWASLDGYPTPPHSADMINPMINPFDEFLDMDSK